MKTNYSSALVIISFFTIVSFFSCTKEDKKAYEVHDFHGAWEFQEDGAADWMRAKVPGSVHQNLLEQSLINDPFYRDEIISQDWVAEKDWVYKSTFDVDPLWLKRSHIALEFQGLDTYAVVMLNGEALVLSDNAFVSWSKEITSIIKERGNELEVHFHSPVAQNKDLNYFDNGDKKGQALKMYNRKPAFQYDSPYGPEWIGQGITAPVKFHLWDDLRMKDVYFKQKTEKFFSADVAAILTIEADGNYEATVNITDHAGKLSVSKAISVSKGVKTYSVDFSVDSIDYWYPHDFGRPALMKLTCDLVSDVPTQSISKEIGFRLIDFYEEEKTSHLTVNDVPFSGKGVALLPLEFIGSTVKDEDYHQLIKDLLKSNVNIVRVHGAGTYQKDIFYDLCDKHGILVWQDIMLSDADYPLESERFKAMISGELKSQLMRLRNHPCIVVWNGNAPEAFKNHSFYTEFLKAEVEKYSHQKYVASAEVLELSSTASYPPMTMIETFTEFDDRYVGSYMMSTHRSQASDDSLIYASIHKEFNPPYDFDQYIYLSQLAQAKALSEQIERNRVANRTKIMFTEQLNDYWPGISRSSIDYFRNWKAAQYQLQKSYSKFLLQIEEDGNEIAINFINDAPYAFEAVLKIQLKDFEGNVLKTAEKEFFIREYANMNFTELNKAQWLKGENKKAVVLQVDLVASNGDQLSNKLHYFVKTKDLALTYPQMPYKVVKEDGYFVLELFTNTLVKDLRLSADYDGFFDKNYFDLLPNDTLQVRFYNKYDLDTFDPYAMQFNSIADSYIDE